MKILISNRAVRLFIILGGFFVTNALVAEFIGGSIGVPTGQEVSAKLLYATPYGGGSGTRQSLFVRKQLSYISTDTMIISQPITYYLTEGESLSISLNRYPTSGVAVNGYFHLTGYLVPKN